MYHSAWPTDLRSQGGPKPLPNVDDHIRNLPERILPPDCACTCIERHIMSMQRKAKTTFPWDPESLAPSLAVTDDWWNQSTRLQPLADPALERTSREQAPEVIAYPAPSSQQRCPACGAVIYSRRHRLCGVCARPLPTEVLFSESESQRLELVFEIERARHRKWLARTSA
jgi:hypothetical protein